MKLLQTLQILILLLMILASVFDYPYTAVTLAFFDVYVSRVMISSYQRVNKDYRDLNNFLSKINEQQSEILLRIKVRLAKYKDKINPDIDEFFRNHSDN